MPNTIANLNHESYANDIISILNTLSVHKLNAIRHETYSKLKLE